MTQELDTGAELSVLGFMAQNPEEFPNLLPIMREFEFSSSVTKYLWACFEQSWKRYEAVPNLAQLRNLIHADKRHGNTQLEVLDRIGQHIFKLNLNGMDKVAVLSRVLDYQRGHMAKRLDGIDALNFKEEAKWIRERLDTLEVLTTGERGQWGFILDERWTSNPHETLSSYLGKPLPTLIKRLDAQLGGGVRGGELMLPAALPGDGKTMLLVSIVCAWVKQGHRVYVCQLDNTFEEFMAKVWCHLLRIPMADLIDPANEDVAKNTALKMQLFQQKHPNIRHQLIVRKWPRGSATIKQMERDMMMFERMLRPYDEKLGVPKDQQGKINAWAGDYLDVFADESSHKSGSERFRFDNVCKDAAGVCERWCIPGVLPSQLNRTSKFIETPDIDNLAEAFSKSWHAAIIPTLFASRSERMLGQMNMFLAKTRRAEEKYVVPLLRDKLHQTFTDDLTRDLYYIDEVRKDKDAQNQQQGQRLKKPKPEPEKDGELVTKVKKLKEAKNATHEPEVLEVA